LGGLNLTKSASGVFCSKDAEIDDQEFVDSGDDQEYEESKDFNPIICKGKNNEITNGSLAPLPFGKSNDDGMNDCIIDWNAALKDSEDF